MTLDASNITASLAQMAPSPRAAWAPVVLMLVIGFGFALGNLVLSLWVGPRRQGRGKSQTYESGVVPIGQAQRRFNVRFYIVAMIFLVLDVDIIFFYPFATIFPGSAASGARTAGGMLLGTLLLIDLLIFVALLLVAYFYAWFKGVFKWD